MKQLTRFALLLVVLTAQFACPSYCDDHPNEKYCGGPGTTVIQPPVGAGGGENSCKTEPSSSAIELSIPYIGQECNELCWDASIDMVAQYYGKNFRECDIASWLVGARTGVQHDCCYYGACNDPYCNQPAQADEMAAVLSKGLSIHGIEQAQPLSEKQIQLELTNHRPIIVGFQGPFSGHAAVIVGYTPGNPVIYHIHDPWPTLGEVMTDYMGLLNGPNGAQWRYSFYQLNTGNSCK